jgi:pilus assembly protein TadC
MSVLLATGLAGLSMWLWLTPWDPTERLARLRAHSLAPDRPADLEPHRAGPEGPDRQALREALSMLAAALGGFLFIGGIPGLIGGVVIGVAVALIGRRREPAEVRRRRARITADLPFALDLMVACLRAGRPVSGAVEAVAEATGGPLGESLAWVTGQLRLGARPEAAWSALEADRPLAALARGMIRAELSGAPVADVLSRLADDARHEGRAASSAAARRVGVQAVAPLGLCFLPAFVFLGIIPVVAGLAGQVFG